MVSSLLLLSSGLVGVPIQNHHSTVLRFPICTFKLSPINHLPSCTCIQTLNISWKKFGAQLIDINHKVHQLLT